MLTTNQKGALAEAKIAATAIECGIGVARPLDDERYDLIFDMRPRLLRVQCKWGRRIGGVISVGLYTSRRGREGMISRRYEPGEFDCFGVYCPDTRACYLLAANTFVAQRNVYLRLRETQNNQQQGVRWARDYEFAVTLGQLRGPIAQLGERRAGSAKAAGSSPAGSIDLDQVTPGERLRTEA
jgi:PD-(D/E)XK nuclease superfamily protein